MPHPTPRDHLPAPGFLMRLLRDRRGNTLAIAAAALIPLLAFSGSAVDMARLYFVKVRLQQACDAGVLAGRRVMTDTTMTGPLDTAATTQSRAFFRNNFREGYLKTTAVDFRPVKASSGGDATVANAVTATATATVPLAIMGFFGARAQKMDVACQAVFDLADTDVMFVLDTTGSMSCRPQDSANCANGIVSEDRGDGTTRYFNQESNGSKIEALRRAVMLFDSTMRSSADSSTRFRYGFVTYASSVNVGRAIPTEFLQNTNWTYQTRRVTGDYNFGNAVDRSLNNVPRSYCVAQRMPATGYERTGMTWSDQGYYQARRYYDLTWSAANGGTCTGKEQVLRPMWRYGPAPVDTAAWLASTNQQRVTNPSRVDGSNGFWRGCIEELNTTTGSNFSVTSLPADLDPDVRPTATDNRWRPQWPDLTWSRRNMDEENVRDDEVDEGAGNPNNVSRNYGPNAFFDRNGNVACGMPARRLSVMSAQDVENYVRDPDFRPYGGTYHDVGMIWGARMLSPDGVFAGDTTARPGRRAPTRNIVFMTDGTMAPSQTSYTLYGVERLANRTGGAGNTATDFENHTARFRVACEAGRRKGYTIYVVALGTAITDELRACASPGQTFQASSTDQLTEAFRSIARRVAMLRITQ